MKKIFNIRKIIDILVIIMLFIVSIKKGGFYKEDSIFFNLVITTIGLGYVIYSCYINYVKKAEKGVTLDIYGFKEDEKYWEKCEEEIQNSNKIKYCGILNQEEVIKTFSKYDLFLFPTYSENYGHVIAESMLGGCPVLISDQTPWNDVKEHGAGFVEKLNDDDSFISVLNNLNRMEENEYKKIKQNMELYISNKINYKEIIKKYKNMFNL